MDDFEKLMLLKALKEEKVNLSFRDKHNKVNIYVCMYVCVCICICVYIYIYVCVCVYLLLLDECEMSQVSVSVLIVLQARLMGNEPSCCQYINMLQADLEMSHVSLSTLACYRRSQK